MIRAVWLFVLLLAGSPAFADPECERGQFETLPYTACTIDPRQDRIALYHSGTDGTPLGSFTALRDHVAQSGQTLVFAMNAGMYHPDRRPVGLYVENGVETARIVLREGPGNFGLLPNGVFCMRGQDAFVVESRSFAQDGRTCDFATQSGPMLVVNGALHPRFLPESTSRKIRNGVGVRTDGTVVMAIADAPVTFHRFARLFRDQLQTPDALFLDGSVSRIYAPDIGRSDPGLPLGPMLGVVGN